jgi:hypothetical protein
MRFGVYRHADQIREAFKRRPAIKALRSLIFLAVVAAIPLAAGITQGQNAGSNTGPPRETTGFPPLSPLVNRKPDANRIMEDSMQAPDFQKRIAQLNLLRQKEMTEDTARLLELAHEVKTETGETAKDSLSVDELHKVEMIEKLARAVHDKMRATVTN